MLRWQRRLGFTYATRSRNTTVTEDQIYYRKQSPSQTAEIIQQRIRFEEVTPANTDAAFLDTSIESLVVPLGLPIYDGYDGLDDLQLTFLTLPSGATVTLASYLNSPQPGTSIHVDSAMQNIPQIIFESCQQLQVSREEALWFHPDWQDEIDYRFETLRERLHTEHGAIEKRPELSQLEELPQQNQYEPIDCFNHALRIYTREYVPATYWAMLQRNLGLAYFNRNQGDRRENLERSIECFNKSLEVYRQDEFPEQWKINQEDLRQSYRLLKSLSKPLSNKAIIDSPIERQLLKSTSLQGVNHIFETVRNIQPEVNLRSFQHILKVGRDVELDNNLRDLKHILTLRNSVMRGSRRGNRRTGINKFLDLRNIDMRGVNLSAANLSGANLSSANLSGVNLSGSNLLIANLHHANLRGANLRDVKLGAADLSGADLSGADLSGANLINANLLCANLSNAKLSDTKWIGANLSGINFRGADVNKTRFILVLGITEFLKKDLIIRGAVFHDFPRDLSESRTLVPH